MKAQANDAIEQIKQCIAESRYTDITKVIMIDIKGRSGWAAQESRTTYLLNRVPGLIMLHFMTRFNPDDVVTYWLTDKTFLDRIVTNVGLGVDITPIILELEKHFKPTYTVTGMLCGEPITITCASENQRKVIQAKLKDYLSEE